MLLARSLLHVVVGQDGMALIGIVQVVKTFLTLLSQLIKVQMEMQFILVIFFSNTGYLNGKNIIKSIGGAFSSPIQGILQATGSGNNYTYSYVAQSNLTAGLVSVITTIGNETFIGKNPNNINSFLYSFFFFVSKRWTFCGACFEIEEWSFQ